jgi:hypothetical protein
LKFEEFVALATHGGGGGGAWQVMLVGENVILTVEPELVRVADPVTVQFPDRFQVPCAVSVAFEPPAVKTMLPSTFVATPSQVVVSA